MTQALAAQEALLDAGHGIAGIFLGTSELRPVPDFFRERATVEVETFEAPMLVPGGDGRGMSPLATALHNLRRIPRYVASGLFLARRLREEDPDVVLNFFDLVSGFVCGLFRPGRRRLVVGHHFLFDHPDFPRPDAGLPGWWGLRTLTAFTAMGADRRIALSFRPDDHPRGDTAVLPPLLRSAILEAKPEEGNHLLVYLLNPGYAAELQAWHREHRDVRVEAFWDRADAPGTLEVHENLRVHRLDDRDFVELLRSCRGLATTAGFESVCEAMYLGKPVLAVPTEGHVEQRCNALDAVRAGAGIQGDRFALDALLEYLPEHRKVGEEYRRWVRSGPGRLVEIVEGCSVDGPPGADPPAGKERH